MRKKVIAISVITAILAVVYVQSVAAAYRPVQGITITAWTDKPQYTPGEKGKLKISIVNSLSVPVSIDEIYVEYPWLTYNAQIGDWEGNETLTGEPLETMPKEGGDYYAEIEFTVPSDGRVTGLAEVIEIDVTTSEGIAEDYPVNLLVMSTALNMAVVDIDMWMTILTATIVICTIILAAVVFLSTRRPTIAAIAPTAKAPRAKA